MARGLQLDAQKQTQKEQRNSEQLTAGEGDEGMGTEKHTSWPQFAATNCASTARIPKELWYSHTHRWCGKVCVVRSVPMEISATKTSAQCRVREGKSENGDEKQMGLLHRRTSICLKNDRQIAALVKGVRAGQAGTGCRTLRNVPFHNELGASPGYNLRPREFGRFHVELATSSGRTPLALVGNELRHLAKDRNHRAHGKEIKLSWYTLGSRHAWWCRY
ncbi:hypothetical protein C8R44DRAFT_858723 [Mycena epipterygia]|nr:hypothetical protein C8R44DRAFT_858723 [Mycena epipterygia]